jgi:hypothetical protein
MKMLEMTGHPEYTYANISTKSGFHCVADYVQFNHALAYEFCS